MPDPSDRLTPPPRRPVAPPPRRPAPPPRGSSAPPPRRGRPVWVRVLGFLVFGFYRVVFLGLVLGLLAGGVGYWYYSQGLPSIEGLKNYKPPLESRVFTNNFQLISELADERRIYVPYDQIPPLVAQAFISTEDRLYWQEPGINPLAIIRASLTDIGRYRSGQRLYGASTITQQVVKNMLLNNHIDTRAKIQELILAVRVGQALSKQQILEIYLNEIDLGNNSFGIAAASEAYFDRPVSKLDIAQAASLAALPKAPSNYNPFLHPQAALTRRNFIIDRMYQDGAITQAQATAAEAEPLLPKAGGRDLTVPDAGYFADAVQKNLTARFGAMTVAQGGLIVHTSMNPDYQTAATNAVRDGLEKYDRSYDGWHGLVAHSADTDLADNWAKDLAKQANPPGMREDWQLGIVLAAGARTADIGYINNASGTPVTGSIPLATMRWARPVSGGNLGPRPDAVSAVLSAGDVIMVSGAGDTMHLEQIPNLQAALISMDPRTGRVLAMVGGWSHDISPFNRVTQASRQPGSSVKPLVYLTAMEQGIQPDATVLDAPFVLQMPDGSVYRPGNYEESFEGPVPMFHALEQSLNLATLHLAQQIGLNSIATTFQNFGIVNPMPPYFPSAIGAINTTLWQMAGAYAALDNEGRQITPTLIDDVTDPDGQVLYQAPGENCDNCVNGDPTQMPSLDYAGQQLADPDSVFQMITMMKGVVLRGTGGPAVVGINQPVAGKTGTTNNFNDAWFIGFTPGVLTGCWTGFDTPANLGKDETGGNVCGPIWNEYMKTALKDQPAVDWLVPDGVTLQQVNFNGQTVTEAFKTGQAPGAQTNSLLGAPTLTPPGGTTTPPPVKQFGGGLY